MNDVRIIKRYANRKLYDTQHSRYVTLDQISEMIRNGDDVKIIDNKTKEDLTSVTLAQIIFEEEKKQRSFLPLQAMRNIIQNGGESFAQLVTEAQRRVTSILPRRKDEEGEEGAEQGEGDVEQVEVVAASEYVTEVDSTQQQPQTGDDGAAHKRPRAALLEFREWIQQSQRTIEEWQKRVDDRIRNVAEGISPFSGMHKELHTLASRIGELESKLAQVAETERVAAAQSAAQADSSPDSSPDSSANGATDGSSTVQSADSSESGNDGQQQDAAAEPAAAEPAAAEPAAAEPMVATGPADVQPPESSSAGSSSESSPN